jgi:integral membrane sensor domain MASE1
MSSPNALGHDYSGPRLFESLRDTLPPSLVPDKSKIIVVIALSYYVTGLLGVRLATPHAGATAVWLPAGVSLAAILLRGTRVWPGIFIGAVIVNLTVGVSILPSLDIATGSTLAAILGSRLINRFAQGTRSFFKSGDTLRFVLLVGLVTALGAAFAVFILCGYHYAGWSEFMRLWRLWWVGDVLGTLLLTPFLVLLLGDKHPSLRLVELSELTILLVGLSVVCVLNFGPPIFSWPPKSGLHYLCVPFLVWAAIRFCPLEAAGATLLVGGFTMWGSLHGYGFFATTSGVPIIAAGYVVVVIASTMTIAATIYQQRKCSEDVLRLYYILKEKYEREIPEPRDTI